ncbi:L-arabinose 1-dehydrogenase (NAD(P)(+)) [Beijerinckiaceae bacterium RH AL1]|nr:L-arabinose 1-dehydrogenase (NAD(P)(+)) [Beijerinckiaceae bacterium RH AL8]VVB43584.1 L-arabinose 1-dehydrogenase (NAD(P)(+)) [Beijerinckiaceae bacterium RH CH11]VVC53906.1 L-arabinose 1-dehydrogenase (NAD(P)(+)) [Beijerinckiaceae bacterium RH AL1]
MAVRLGIVGIGKIARDKHIPALEASPDFALVAGASHEGAIADRPTYRSLEEMLAGGHDLAAVALCQPPQVRFQAAWAAIEAGCHVLLEKPPGATACEVELLADHARTRGVTLFASWHARFAPAVEAARAWLAGREIKSIEIVWKEDVRHWHPGQAWIWEPGGLGVFDPGINALSIATHILPRPFYLVDGTLEVPANKAAPIAADLAFTDAAKTPIHMALDWRQTGQQTWTITVATDAGPLVLSQGGKALTCAGAAQAVSPIDAYPNLYRHFAALIAERRSDVDIAPMRHVADAFLRARRVEAEPFED